VIQNCQTFSKRWIPGFHYYFCNFSHSESCILVSQCNSILHSPTLNDVEDFLCAYLNPYVLSKESYVWIFCSFINLIFLIISLGENSLQVGILWICSSSVWLSFRFLASIILKAGRFKFWWNLVIFSILCFELCF
jgi:hypothetical protein